MTNPLSQYNILAKMIIGEWVNTETKKSEFYSQERIDTFEKRWKDKKPMENQGSSILVRENLT